MIAPTREDFDAFLDRLLAANAEQGQEWTLPSHVRREDYAMSVRVSDAELCWHAVADGLPAEDTAVIIYAPSMDPDKPLIVIAWYDPASGFSLIPVWAEAVTHWMYLPEPPDDTEETT